MNDRSEYDNDKYAEYEDYYDLGDERVMPERSRVSSKWRKKEKERTIKIRKARRQKKQRYET